jgi:hypothetical protein
MEFTTIANAKKATGLSYLGGTNISAKLTKNGKVNQLTYGVYLSPASTSGYNVCLHSTPECRLGCLATSGRAAIDIFSGVTRISDARIKKTKLFHEDQQFFMQWLIAEIISNKRKAEKQGLFFSVRLNCTSDIDWATILVGGLNIFEIFPDISMYDYTKQITKLFNPIANYHLTLSYTGYKDTIYQSMLKQGNNIAVVFNVKHEADLPKTFMGFPVINGDLTDYRIQDAKGVVVGLKWKRIADRKAEKQILNSVFVVQPNDVRCGYGSETEIENINVHELVNII